MTVTDKHVSAGAKAGSVVFVSDAPVDEDRLNSRPLQETAEALVSGLLNSIDPLTVGIFGAWGSGKTSLMKMIERLLNERHKALKKGEPEILPVFFEAWRYEREKVPLIPLLKTIETTLRKRYGKDESYCVFFARAAYALAHATKIVLPGVEFELERGLKQDTSHTAQIQQLQDDYYRLVELLSAFVEDNEVRLVILIDDLDRCGETALDILESTKTVFHIPGVSFVIGLDTRPIGSWLTKKYGGDTSITPELYLEKMISVPFHLPIEPELERGHLLSEFRRNIPGFATVAIYEPSVEEATLRRIKRILNEASLILSIAKEATDADLLVGLISLRETDPKRFAELCGKSFSAFRIAFDADNAIAVKMADKKYRGFWKNFKSLTNPTAEASYRRWMNYLPVVFDARMESNNK